MQKILLLWQKLSNIGTNHAASDRQAITIRMFNQISFCLIFMHILLLIQDLFINDIDVIAIDIGYLTMMLSGPILNHFNYHAFAKMSFMLIYPFTAALLIVVYGDALHTSYSYIAFIMSVTIVYDSKRYMIPLLVYIIGLWATMMYYIHNFGSLVTYNPTILDMSVTPICVTLIILLVIPSYKREVAESAATMTLLLAESQKQNQELSAANSELESFAYIASHDLKTPLRTIVSYLDIIERKIKQGDTNNLSEYIGYARNGGMIMNKMVTEILELSKLNMEDKVTLQTVDLNYVVGKNLNYLSSIIKTKNVSIVKGDLPKIQSNEMLVGLLLQNLIENGIKYNTSEIPTVEIQSAIENQKTVISIKDNGIGIAPEFQQSVFQLFTRLHSDQEYTGTGMGLAICKKITERLGATIRLTSAEGQGATFFITFQ
jgi:signal transduction histidine kinase